MLKIKASFTFVQFSSIRKLAFFFLFSVTQKSARNPGNSLLGRQFHQQTCAAFEAQAL